MQLASIRLIASVMAICSTGCLVQETVTENGAVVKEGYAIKRPLRDSIEDSN